MKNQNDCATHAKAASVKTVTMNKRSHATIEIGQLWVHELIVSQNANRIRGSLYLIYQNWQFDIQQWYDRG